MDSQFICQCHNIQFKNRHALTSHIYYYKHREKVRQQINTWHNNHSIELKERYREYDKTHKAKYHAHYLKNKKTLLQSMSEYYLNNKEKILESRGIYYQNNKENIIKKNTEYAKTEKGKLVVRLVQHNRRVIPYCSKLTIETIQQVYENNIKKYGTLTCELCFEPILFGEDSLEHFIPLSRHKEFPHIDLNAPNNLGVAHSQFSKEKCNLYKNSKTLKEWQSGKLK